MSVCTQLHAQTLFHFLDGTRQRRLVDVQVIGRAGEVEFFRYGKKAAHVMRFQSFLPAIFDLAKL